MLNPLKAYRDQRVLLASKHAKERVIAPAFYQALGCQVIAADFDTDQFGTFSGEVPRPANPYDTCVLKAKAAAAQTDYQWVIASEGSFGPHPSNPFAAFSHEIMVFVDLQHDWTIAEHVATSNTNYMMMDVEPGTDITPFLNAAQFPSHGLVLQVQGTGLVLAKGITDADLLLSLMEQGFSEAGSLRLSTDMRAMMNPTRMQVLHTLALKLTQRILTPCASCHAPGFGFVATAGQLPCALCGALTSMPQYDVWGCVACTHKEQRSRADQVLQADPAYCQFCNP